MESLLYHCLSAFPLRPSTFSAFFLTGLVGGATHCVGMCGPIAASGAFNCASCSKLAGNVTPSSPHAGGWSYHLGRMITYGGLGFAAAFFSRQIAAASFWPWISAVMLTVAAAMFLKASIPSCGHKFPHPSLKRNFIQGLLLGFMPCGLIYAALMVAATLANPVYGMIAMWLFVLGTMPALLVTSSGIKYVAWRWRAATHKIWRAMLVFNGLSLLVIAAKNVI